jgi:type III restriction enzyme
LESWPRLSRSLRVLVAKYEALRCQPTTVHKGKEGAFYINSFKSNHYPDFYLFNKRGIVILLETKGEYLNNPDNLDKCSIGDKWQEPAGEGFKYVMDFERDPILGA